MAVNHVLYFGSFLLPKIKCKVPYLMNYKSPTFNSIVQEFGPICFSFVQLLFS